jgi:PAS domain S-box-containing protein
MSETDDWVPGVHLGHVIALCVADGAAEEAIFRGTGPSLAAISRDGQRIDWQTFSALCENLALAVDEERLLRHAETATAEFRRLALMGRYVYSLEETYRYGFGSDGLITRHYPLQIFVDGVDSNRLIFHVRMPGGHSPLRAVDLILQGHLNALPGLLGYPRPQVGVTRTGRSTIFDVRFRGDRSLRARVTDLLNRVFNVRQLALELGTLHRQLIEQYRRAAAEEARIQQFQTLQQSSDARYRILADNIRDVIWTTDLDMKFTYVSPSVEKVLGFRPEEWEGLSLSDVLPERTSSYLTRHVSEQLLQLDQASDPRSERTIELEAYHRDGRLIPFEVRATFLFAEGERVVGIIGVARDITDRRHNDIARRKLERQVQVTQQLHSIGRLAGSMAHDFGILVDRILAHARRATLVAQVGAEAREELRIVEETASQASELTSRLLAFSRQQVMQPVTLDLNSLVREFDDLLQRLLAAGIRLRLAPAAQPLEVFADPGLLRQVLINLVLNARDAIGTEGTIDMVLGASDPARARKPGRFARLEVRDDGVGMGADVLEHVFEPFFSTKPSTENSGLGLSVALGIVEQHGGWIEVQSTPGAGSCFTVHLPLVDGAAPAAG